MLFEDLGLIAYRAAWARQEEAHARVVEGAEERAFLLEHPPVITFGRRPGVEKNLLASDRDLFRLGVEVVPSDRGGDITYHGPGQLVVYPIVRLADHRLSVSGYVRAMEHVVIAVLGEFGIAARLDSSAIGVWVEHGDRVAKICALGVRIRRGVSMHGIALNVTTNLQHFDLINPCGIGRPVTSLQKILGEASPSMERVKQVMRVKLADVFSTDAACL